MRVGSVVLSVLRRLSPALFLLAVASEVYAEPEPDPVALALFKRGRALIAEGDWADGCAKIAQSFEREANASALLNLARCDEHAGKIASAWTRHQKALPLIERISDPTRRAELSNVAATGIKNLENRLPKLRVTAEERPAGLIVKDQDGRILPLDEELPLDPGPTTIVAEAPRFRRATFSVLLSERRTTTLAVALVREADEMPGAARGAFVGDSTVRPNVASASRSRGSLVWPVAIGAVGVALSGVAIGFGVDAANANASLKARCGADLVCTEDPTFDPSPLNDRKNAGLAVAIGAGAAGAITLGVATWLAWRSGRTMTVTRSPGAPLVRF